MKTLQKLKRAGNRNNQLREKGNVVSGKKEEKSYKKQKVCHICKQEFNENIIRIYCKVRDHCHYTGKYMLGVGGCS